MNFLGEQAIRMVGFVRIANAAEETSPHRSPYGVLVRPNWCVRSSKNYAGRGAVFIGASMDDAKTRDRVADFVREHNISFLFGMTLRRTISMS
jgi:hypothetical protein